MTAWRSISSIVACLAAIATPAVAQPSQTERDAIHRLYVKGNFEKAEEILLGLLEGNANDADLLRRLAAVQAAREKLELAQATIDRAILIAPDDNDIRLARANILFWRGLIDEARLQADQIVKARPDYPGLVQISRALDNATPKGRLHVRSMNLGGSVSSARFAAGFNQTWFVQRATMAVELGGGRFATIDVEREERLLTDTRISGRLDATLTSGRYFVSGSITPQADFRENFSVGGGAEFDLASRTILQLDGRFAEYQSDDVVALGVGLKRRFSINFDIEARSIHLFGGGDSYRFGAAVRATYHNGRLPDSFVVIASYPDAEVDGTRQLKAIAAGVRLKLSDRLGLGVTGEYETRRDSYKRSAISADLRWHLGG